MHVLFLPSWYPAEDDPIRGSFFREQAQALARSGHRVSVFARHQADVRGYEVKKTEDGGLTEYHIRYHVLRLPVNFLYVLFIMCRLIRKEFRNDRPDIIHVQSYGAGIYARALKRLFGIPFVLTEHTSRIKRTLPAAEEARIRRCCRSASALIAVSQGLAEHMRRFTDREIRVIPNMVDPRFLDTPLRDPAEGRFRYVFVGNLSEAKGVFELLDAFTSLRVAERETELVFCGDGDAREEILRRIRERGLSDSVFLRGQVSREQCAREIMDACVLVLPSRSETFGVVCAEALACGRPIVTTKTDAWPSMVTPATGLAVEIGDPDGLRDAMERVCREYGLYDAETIRAYCRDRFSPGTVCRRITRVYEEALGR